MGTMSPNPTVVLFEQSFDERAMLVKLKKKLARALKISDSRAVNSSSRKAIAQATNVFRLRS